MWNHLIDLPWRTLAGTYALALVYCAFNYRKMFSASYLRILGFWLWLGFFVALVLVMVLSFSLAFWLVELAARLTYFTKDLLPAEMGDVATLRLYTLYALAVAMSAILTGGLGDRLYVWMLNTFSHRCAQAITHLQTTKVQQTFKGDHHAGN